MNRANKLRKQTIKALERMGMEVPYSHHEVASGRHEINLHHALARRMADTCIVYKYVVKEVASRNDVYATFMPKPVEGENGSGMYTHQSLFKDGKNTFFDPDNTHHLSETPRNTRRAFSSISGRWLR